MAINYARIYDVFGGESATNDLIASFKSMGLDDATIESVFAPYVPVTTPAPSGALSQATADNTAQAATTTTAGTVTDADILGWFNANPGADDALIATTMRDAGVSPDRLATVLNVDAGDVTARYNAALNVGTTSTADSTTGALSQATAGTTGAATDTTSTGALTQAATDSISSGTDTTTTYLGGSDTAATDNAASNANTSSIELEGQIYTIDNSIVSKLTDQIIAQGTTSKWSGAGYGSPEANAKAMAEQLAANGITDINQVAKIDQKVDEAVTPKYEYYETGQVDSDGVPIMGATLVGYFDKNGKEVDAALVKAEQVYDEYGGGTNYVAPIGTKSVIGNKDTGKALINAYGERGGVGDAWSGTYVGKGNTAFRTAFDANGKPIFYTTGASSSNVGDFAPLLAIASFIPGVAPFAQAINAAIAIDSGDVLGGLASLAGAGGFTDAATGLRVAKALDSGDFGALATSLLQNPTISSVAGSTMLTDTISLKDAGGALNVVNNLANNNITGALSAAGQLTGSTDLQTAGAALNVVQALQSGNELAIINAVGGLNNTLNAVNNLGNQTVASNLANSVNKVEVNNDVGFDAYKAAIAAGATPEDAMAAANAVTGNKFNLDLAVNKEIEKSQTFDATGAADLNAAAAAASNANAKSFTFEGKTYDLTTNAPTERVVQDILDEDDKRISAEIRAASFLQISNTEADSPEEAAALARAKGETQFMFDGKEYTMDDGGKNAVRELEKTVQVEKVTNAKTFNDAYAAAREAFGAGKVFTWNGKQYTTDSREENPSLAAASDAKRLNAIADSTIAGAGRGSAASYASYDAATAAENYAKANVPKSLAGGTTGGGAVNDVEYDQAGNVISGSMGSVDDKSVLGRATNAFNNALGYVVQNGLTNLARAGGEQTAAFGGALATIGLTGADNMLVRAGQAADKFGASIESEESKKGTQNIINAVSSADGMGAKLIAGLKAGWNNPTAALNLVTREGLQEILPIGTALKASKMISIGAAAGLDTAMNAAESMGAAYNDAYQGALSKGMSKADADALATKVGLSAGAITLVTSGVMDAALVKTIFREGSGSVGKQLATGSTKEGVSENIEETATALATQYLTTGKIDWGDAMTQGAIGHLIGKSAAGTVGTVDASVAAGDTGSTITATGNTGSTVTAGTGQTTGTGATNLSTTGDNTTGSTLTVGADTTAATNTQAANDFSSIFLSTGDTSTAATTAVDTAIASGANAATAVGSTITAAGNTGSTGNVTTAVNSSVTAALNNNADVKSTVDSAVTAAVTGGVSANVAAATAANAAVVAGVDATTASNVASNAAANATTGAATTTGANANTAATTGATTTTGANANTAATVDSTVSNNVTAALDSGTNVNSAVGTAVTSSITSGTNANTAVTSAVTAAVTAGVDANAAVNAAVTAAVAAGVDVTTATNIATNAVTNANTNTAVDSNATTNTAANTNTATNTAVDANTNTNTNANTNTNTAVDSNVTTNTAVDANTNTATTTTTNANTNTNTTVTTNADTNTTTTTNVNNNTNVTTNTVTDTNTNTTTNTVTDTNTNTTVNVTLDTTTGQVISVDGPGTVIDKDTVVVDGTAIDIQTGEILTPEQVEERKTAAITKTSTPTKKKVLPALMAGLAFNEPTYAAKDHDISETWLGGMFRNNPAPLAGMGALMPEGTPMFQEAQALSALRRASGVEGAPKSPEADYYAYGSEPSYSKVLEPYMNGGTVQKYAEGGKIMASPLMAASGGDVPHKGSHYVQGAGGGQDDLISAKLADGEYVFDADIVAALGDGSNKEGAKKLDAMREAIRKHKRGGSIKSIPPAAKSPLAYLKGVL